MGKLWRGDLGLVPDPSPVYFADILLYDNAFFMSRLIAMWDRQWFWIWEAKGELCGRIFQRSCPEWKRMGLKWVSALRCMNGAWRWSMHPKNDSPSAKRRAQALSHSSKDKSCTFPSSALYRWYDKSWRRSWKGQRKCLDMSDAGLEQYMGVMISGWMDRKTQALMGGFVADIQVHDVVSAARSSSSMLSTWAHCSTIWPRSTRMRV